MHGLELSQCVVLSGLIPVVYLNCSTDVSQDEGVSICVVLSGNRYCLSSAGASDLFRPDFCLVKSSPF